MRVKNGRIFRLVQNNYISTASQILYSRRKTSIFRPNTRIFGKNAALTYSGTIIAHIQYHSRMLRLQ